MKPRRITADFPFVGAFEQLVFHYQDRLYRFLLARAISRADAEDALQETFAAAFRYISGYRSRYRFSTWLYTIARNLCIDHMRKPARREKELFDDPKVSEVALPFISRIDGADPRQQEPGPRPALGRE